MTEPLTPAPPQRSWWDRNWKWVVPAGCLGLLAALAGFFVAIAAIVFGTMKSTDVYKQAVATARSNPAIVEALGEPLETGWFLSGTINTSGSSGDADVSIPLHGPKGAGTLYAVAAKSAGRWEFNTLEVEVEGQAERIDLLAAARED